MTDKEVASLIEEFHVPQHVRRHCAAVAHFAVSLGKKFVELGEPIDLKALRHAAILHDFVRVVDFREFRPEAFPDPVSASEVAFWKKLREKYTGRHHAEVAAEILRERGFPKIAEIVRKHRFLQIQKGFDTWEEKLLYYADKRLKHDSIVSLKERLADGRARNAPEMEGKEASRKLDALVLQLEQEILEKIKTLRFPPH